MTYLIISDIHGNLEALEAVLKDADKDASGNAGGRYERILCLGDLVGYGADPNAIVERVREKASAVIRGNHDRVTSGLEEPEAYNPVAQASILWTRGQLSERSRTYLERLPRGPLPVEGCDLVHGSPMDEDEYLLGVTDAAAMRGSLQSRVTWFGHTHVQGGFLIGRAGAKRIDPKLSLEVESNYYFLINPGSVGQPRDGDCRAAYALYSPLERTVEFRRVAYDVDRAAAKIRAAGLPDFLAARLFEGK